MKVTLKRIEPGPVMIGPDTRVSVAYEAVELVEPEE